MGNVPTNVETGIGQRRCLIIMRPVRGGQCRRFCTFPVTTLQGGLEACHSGSSPSHGLVAGLPNHRVGTLGHVRRRQGTSELRWQSGPSRMRISPGPSCMEPETPGPSCSSRPARFRRHCSAFSASSSSQAWRSAWQQPECRRPGRRSEMFLPRSRQHCMAVPWHHRGRKGRMDGSGPRQVRLSRSACTVAGLSVVPSTTPGGCLPPPASTPPMARAIRRLSPAASRPVG